MNKIESSEIVIETSKYIFFKVSRTAELGLGAPPVIYYRSGTKLSCTGNAMLHRLSLVRCCFAEASLHLVVLGVVTQRQFVVNRIDAETFITVRPHTARRRAVH